MTKKCILRHCRSLMKEMEGRGNESEDDTDVETPPPSCHLSPPRPVSTRPHSPPLFSL